MNFTHGTETRDGHTLDILADLEHGTRIMVSRLGAELVSLAKQHAGEWVGFLYRDADVSKASSGWNNHSTLMGFYMHRLKGERSVYRGREIRGGTHSFLRHKTFGPPEFNQTNGTLTYRISPSEILPEEYPGNVALALTYSLSGGVLEVQFEFENLDRAQSAHVSFGMHPGFAVDSIESAEVIFPAGKYLRHIAPGNFLSGESVEIEHAGGPMRFPKEELPASFLLELADVPERVFELHTGDRRVSLGFEQVPYVTVWSDGNPFICIEPCWGLPDHHEQRLFEQKAGIQEIAAGGKLSRRFTITPAISTQ